MTSARTMLILDVGRQRFQMRAGALIRKDDFLLIHRGETDAFWTVPGGRVEMGETGAETLEREIADELGVSSVAGPMRFMIENFFEYEGRTGHEIGLYYDVRLTANFPFQTEEIVHRHHDSGVDLEFRWVVPTPEILENHNLKPAPFRKFLGSMTDQLTHIVCRDDTA